MVTRNIPITLEQAKEWFKSNNADLKRIALQAYTKEELTTNNWQNIKTFKDACKALNIEDVLIKSIFYNPDAPISHVAAIYRLDIIRKALNGKDWKPKTTKGEVYYPYVRFYPAGDKVKKAIKGKDWTIQETFIADGEKYTLVGGDYDFSSYGGLANFGYGYGYVQPSLGLLGCKSKEIAQHMSKYFAKEIFEATYAQYAKTYEWV